MRNKKGDVPVTILVLGVFIICSLAIASFYIANNKVKKDFYSVDVVKSMSLYKDRIQFYKNTGLSADQIKELFNALISEDGKMLNLNQGKVSINYALP